ncbi:probable ubiquitin-conjugating enzyme protein 17 [Ptychodera flava]|uniref:probable ubiquitin-conjugating enzyme protein 17 n=1 Tax=Ptychodera flava TaxID=63121 RepID=UPI003969D4C2
MAYSQKSYVQSSHPPLGHHRGGYYRQGSCQSTHSAGYTIQGGYTRGSHPSTGFNSNPESHRSAFAKIEEQLRKLASVSETQPRADLKKPSPGVKQSLRTSQSSRNAYGNEYWSRGVGFGHSQRPDWNVPAHMRDQREKDKQIESALNGTLSSIREFLQSHGTTGGTRQQVADPIPGLYRILEDSVLVPFLEKYLKGVTFLELNRHAMIYKYILEVIKEIAVQPKLVGLLCALPHQQQSVYEYLEVLESEAKKLLERTGKGTVAVTQSYPPVMTQSRGQTAGTISVNDLLGAIEQVAGTMSPYMYQSSDERTTGEVLAKAFLAVFDMVSRAVSARCDKRVAKTKVKVGHTSEVACGRTPRQESLEARYKRELRDVQFKSCEIPMTGPHSHRFATYNHHGRLDSRLMFRLAQEYASLSSSLPLHLSSAIFVRTDDSKMNLMQALIVGPEDTPYSGGCYLFDIFFPHNYPSVPPQVHLQTTGGGAVRFNPNLYNCGKVCLSLLGTWSGQGGETWTELSTVLQLLVSIQSLILVSEPYFNEPGYESQMRTDYGRRNSQTYNQGVRVNNIKYAILAQLRNPSPAFEGVIKTHFRLKRDKILQEAEAWLQSTPSDRQLREQIDNLRVEFRKLPVCC